MSHCWLRLRSGLRAVGAASSAHDSREDRVSRRGPGTVRSGQSRPWQAWEVEVHHRIDLRFSNLFPKADPHKLASLVALQKGAHNVVTQATNRFLRVLGREPTPTEVMAHRFELDKLMDTFLVRAGVPRPPPGVLK